MKSLSKRSVAAYYAMSLEERQAEVEEAMGKILENQLKILAERAASLEVGVTS